MQETLFSDPDFSLFCIQNKVKLFCKVKMFRFVWKWPNLYTGIDPNVKVIDLNFYIERSLIEGFSYDLEMKTCEQNRNNNEGE